MTSTDSIPRRPTYLDLWRRTPGSALYLLLVFPLAVASICLLMTLFWTGVGLIVLVVGLPLVVFSLLVARGLGTADRYLLRLTGRPVIGDPMWGRGRPAPVGFWATLIHPMKDPHYWVYLVHGGIVNVVVSSLSFAITVAWLAGALGGLTQWFWQPFIPGDSYPWGEWVVQTWPLFGGWNGGVLELVLEFALGLVFAVTLPWVLNGLAAGHHAIAAAMLGPWDSDRLAAEVAAEQAARGAAVQAEDRALRRLERDIHDGPQQRLVRLQLDLAALERRAAAGDPDAATALAREAQVHAKAALDELRALSSGVAPPLLQDRGLVAALGGLAATNPVPVTTTIDPAIDQLVAPEVARSAYFIAAELLTNTVKHAEARTATLSAQLREGGYGLFLELQVADDGRGGAGLTTGHGLEGLRERAHGLRGELHIDSPAGGPTRITAQLPATPPA